MLDVSAPAFLSQFLKKKLAFIGFIGSLDGSQFTGGFTGSKVDRFEDVLNSFLKKLTFGSHPKPQHHPTNSPQSIFFFGELEPTIPTFPSLYFTPRWVALLLHFQKASSSSKTHLPNLERPNQQVDVADWNDALLPPKWERSKMYHYLKKNEVKTLDLVLIFFQVSITMPHRFSGLAHQVRMTNPPWIQSWPIFLDPRYHWIIISINDLSANLRTLWWASSEKAKYETKIDLYNTRIPDPTSTILPKAQKKTNISI